LRALRIVYKPTLRGVIYAAVEDVFFGCSKFAALVVREAVKWFGGFEDSCNDANSGKKACDCLKYKLLRLVRKVLDGDDDGLKEADVNITDAVYYFLFNRIRSLLVVRYASAIVNEAGLEVADVNIADAVYYFLFSRIRDLLVASYASAIANDVGDPVRGAVEDYGSGLLGGGGCLKRGSGAVQCLMRCITGLISIADMHGCSC